MIDLKTDRLVPLLDGLEAVLSCRPSPACAWRLHTKGVLVQVPLPEGGTGTRRVKLETVRFAGRRFTTVAAVREFAKAMNPSLSVAAAEVGAAPRDLDARLREAGLLSPGPGDRS